MEDQKEVIIGNKDAVRSYVNQICSVQSRSFATNSYQTKDNISFVCYSVRHMSKAEKALSSSCKFHVKAKLSSRIDGKQCWKLKQHCFHTCTHEESKRKRRVPTKTKLALTLLFTWDSYWDETWDGIFFEIVWDNDLIKDMSVNLQWQVHVDVK